MTILLWTLFLVGCGGSVDNDGDGYSPDSAKSPDCDDQNPDIHPGATEVCGDGIDANCVVDCAWTGLHSDTDATASYLGATASGGASSGFLGGNIAGGADINGDGYPDVALADRAYDTGSGYNQGRVYLLSGRISGLNGDLSAPAATLTGDGTLDRFGGGVGMLADVNQDGMDELLIGASTDNNSGRSDCGSAFLFRGPVSGSLAPADADIRISGDTAGEYAGWVVNGAGDLNGDNVEDWVVSAYFSDSRAGKVAVVSGALGDGNYDIGTMEAVISGVSADERFGTWAEGGLDLNGDGQDDLVVASLGNSSVYLYYGPIQDGSSASADVTISGVDLTENTTSYEANCIGCVSRAGDPNGDGYEDLLLGADGYDEGAFSDVGAAYLMNGPILGSTSTASAAATFLGTLALDYAGRAVAGGGDLDADGRDDLLISEHGYDVVDGEGRVGLAYGPVSGSMRVDDLDGIVGTESRANLGAALAMVGDVNADGADDMVLGAPNASDNGNLVGRAWFFEGRGE